MCLITFSIFPLVDICVVPIVLAVMNSVAVNNHVQVFEYLFPVLLGIFLEVELLGHMVILYFTL